jgi:flavin-dependent dehydrogenase
VRGVALRTPGGTLVRGIARRGADAHAEAAMVPRLRFDAALVAMAVEAGATLYRLRATAPLRDATERVVGVATRAAAGAHQDPATPPTGFGSNVPPSAAGPDFSAPLVIAADGWGSAIARALLGQDAARPAQRGIAARCYLEGVRGLHGRMRFYCERDLMPGCAWIFPLSGDRANVGLGTLVRDDVPPPRLAERLARFIADPASPAAALLAGALPSGETASWPLAIGWRPGPLAFDGALLAGDAAALVSPMSGSGIAAALHSGYRAASVGLRALAASDTSRGALLPYERRMRLAFQSRYALEHAGQALVADPARLDLVGALASGLPYGQALAARLLFNLG